MCICIYLNIFGLTDSCTEQGLCLFHNINLLCVRCIRMGLGNQLVKTAPVFVYQIVVAVLRCYYDKALEFHCVINENVAIYH